MLTDAKKKRLPCYCSFCGKRDDEVGYLVAGPTVFICNECVELCRSVGHEILTTKGEIAPLLPVATVTALYKACPDASSRVALDRAWATFRGFDLPEKPGRDNNLRFASDGSAAGDHRGEPT